MNNGKLRATDESRDHFPMLIFAEFSGRTLVEL